MFSVKQNIVFASIESMLNEEFNWSDGYFGADIADNGDIVEDIADIGNDMLIRATEYGFHLDSYTNNPSPQVIGCEVGDDTACISNSIHYCLARSKVTSTFLNMIISEMDTWVSTTIIQVAEDSFLIPAGMQGGYLHSAKTGEKSLLGFFDVPKIRLILTVRKAVNEFSSTPSGKCSQLTRYRNNAHPVSAAALDVASLLQDRMIGINRLDMPKYMPTILGGCGAQLPFEHPNDLYNHLLTYRNGSRARFYESCFRELLIRFQSFHFDKESLGEPVLLKSITANAARGGWIYGSNCFTLASELSLPKEIASNYDDGGCRLHRTKLHDTAMNSMCQRLVNMRHMYTGQQLHILLNQDDVLTAIVKSSVKFSDQIDNLRLLHKGNKSNNIPHEITEVGKRLEEFCATYKDWKLFENYVTQGILKMTDGTASQLQLATCKAVSEIFRNKDHSISDVIFYEDYYDKERVDSILSRTNWHVQGINLDILNIVPGTKPRSYELSTVSDVSSIRFDAWGRESIEKLRNGQRPTAHGINDDDDIIARANNLYLKGYTHIGIMTKDISMIKTQIVVDKPQIKVYVIDIDLVDQIIGSKTLTEKSLSHAFSRFMGVQGNAPNIPVIIDTGYEDVRKYVPNRYKEIVESPWTSTNTSRKQYYKLADKPKARSARNIHPIQSKDGYRHPLSGKAQRLNK